MVGERSNIRATIEKKGGYREEVHVHIKGKDPLEVEVIEQFIKEVLETFVKCMEVCDIYEIEIRRK